MNNTVKAQWNSFKSSDISVHNGLLLQDEMRMSFYAGALSMHNLMTATGDYSEEAAMQMIDMLFEECMIEGMAQIERLENLKRAA